MTFSFHMDSGANGTCNFFFKCQLENVTFELYYGLYKVGTT
jgi:hypothetical protein